MHSRWSRREITGWKSYITDICGKCEGFDCFRVLANSDNINRIKCNICESTKELECNNRESTKELECNNWESTKGSKFYNYDSTERLICTKCNKRCKNDVERDDLHECYNLVEDKDHINDTENKCYLLEN